MKKLFQWGKLGGILASVLLTACAVDEAENPDAGVVLFLGDSIMNATAPQTAVGFQTSEVQFIAIQNSIPSAAIAHADDYWIPRIEIIRSRVSIDYAVINLGHNDLNGDFYSELREGRTAGIMAALNGVKVFWVLPHSGVCGRIPQGGCEAFRTMLENQVVPPTLVDFDSYFESHGHTAAEMIGPDGTHLTPEGTIVYAAMMYDAVKQGASD